MFGSPNSNVPMELKIEFETQKKNYYIKCRWYMAWKLDVVDALVL